MLKLEKASAAEDTRANYQQHATTETNNSVQENLQAEGQQVICPVDELRPHPSFARHRLNVPASALSIAASQADLGLREPISITQDNVILKGYPQWELAKLQSRETVRCIKYSLSEEEALQWLLHSHRRSQVLNDFARIVLALDLEPSLHEKGRSNQSTGGHHKGSSTLAEAARIDVRSQIAAAAAVSSGNVTKVKQLLPLMHSDVREALQLGQLSIHRAWRWRNLSLEQQAQRLFQHQSAKGVKKTIRQLVSKHLPEEAQRALALSELLRSLQEVGRDVSRSIQVAVVDTPGFRILVSKELFHAFICQEELPL